MNLFVQLRPGFTQFGPWVRLQGVPLILTDGLVVTKDRRVTVLTGDFWPSPAVLVRAGATMVVSDWPVNPTSAPPGMFVRLISQEDADALRNQLK